MTPARLLAEADSWAWYLATIGHAHAAKIVAGLAAELRAAQEREKAEGMKRVADLEELT